MSGLTSTFCPQPFQSFLGHLVARIPVVHQMPDHFLAGRAVESALRKHRAAAALEARIRLENIHVAVSTPTAVAHNLPCLDQEIIEAVAETALFSIGQSVQQVAQVFVRK